MKQLQLVILFCGSVYAAQPALTIYNDGFAVVRETLPIDLKSGTNLVAFPGVTAMVEPDTVILRDIAGRADFQIFEQSYRNDPVSERLLLSLFEGKEIEFIQRSNSKPDTIVTGKVVRSGYQAAENPNNYGAISTLEPIIEVDGKLQFFLPGKPRFPSLSNDNVLKPTLNWKLNSMTAQKIEAEVAYLSNGFSWEASYNLVAPEKGESVDIVGWVTMKNECGKTFTEAKIKLMAGDVNRVKPNDYTMRQNRDALRVNTFSSPSSTVVEKSFDEFHIYTLNNPTTLRDKETKQVEFVRAKGVKAERIYVYEGRSWDYWGKPNQPTKVQVYREIMNTEANGLGMPLPKGTFRFYTQDDDRGLEFVGENVIDHTPRDERIRVLTGNSFDLVGERRQTDLRRENDHVISEAYEIKVRNRKKEPVEIRAVEHIAPWTDWSITENSLPFVKLASHKIEFRVPLKPNEERVITYRTNYKW